MTHGWLYMRTKEQWTPEVTQLGALVNCGTISKKEKIWKEKGFYNHSIWVRRESLFFHLHKTSCFHLNLFFIGFLHYGFILALWIEPGASLHPKHMFYYWGASSDPVLYWLKALSDTKTAILCAVKTTRLVVISWVSSFKYLLDISSKPGTMVGAGCNDAVLASDKEAEETD